MVELGHVLSRVTNKPHVRERESTLWAIFFSGGMEGEHFFREGGEFENGSKFLYMENLHSFP